MKRYIYKILSIVLCASILLPSAAASVSAQDMDTGTAPRRISVCINGDSISSRGFCWYTDIYTDTVVCIYKGATDISGSLTFSDASCSEWEGAYVHKVVVSGLESGQKYTYRVGNGEEWSETGTFVTDDGDDRLSFIAIADVQAGSLENFEKGAATLSAAFKTMPGAEFVVNLGDFTNDSTNEEWDFYDEAFSQLNRCATLVPVSGNHDGLGVWNWFSNMFCLDTSESVQSLNGINYSYDYGNAHFAVLNTNDMLSVSDAQLQWLTNDMKSTDKDWKIVFMHKSPYTLGKDGKWPDALYLQDALTDVFDECGVDLVMSGHDHMYLRTKTLCGNEVSEGGTTYVLAGTAGSKRYEVRSFLADSYLKTENIDAMVIQKSGYGNYWNGTDWNSTSPTNIGGCFNCVSIDGGTLTLKSYILADEKASDGSDVITNVDTYTVTKETGMNEKDFFSNNDTSVFDYAESAVPSIASLLAYTLTKWLPKFITIIPDIISVYIKDGTF